MKTKFLLLVVSCLWIYSALAQSKNAKPNIIYIYADDLGYGELGSYGQQKIKTPNLDNIAAEGIRFTQHYTTFPVCAPARCGLMTGQNAGHSFIRGNFELGGFEDSSERGQKPLPDGIPTIAKMMKDAGYVTGAIGKWGMGFANNSGNPNKQGFDYFYGYYDQKQAHNFYPTHLWENGKWDTLRNSFVNVHQRFKDARDSAFERFTGKDYSLTKMGDKTIEFIKANKDKPFFLYLPYTGPHVSLQAPEEAVAEYKGLFDDKPYYGEKNYAPCKYPRATYAAMITYMDKQIGRVMNLIKELGLDNNTIIMFSSDNGATFETGGFDPTYFNSNGGLRGAKQDLYEGGIREPFIARWPNKIQPGSATGLISAQYDMMATLADIIKVKPPQNDGISMLPTMLNKGKQNKHEYLYFEFPEKSGQVAIRMGRWKGVKSNMKTSKDALWEVYDLETDVAEKNDIAAQHPELVKQFEAIMRKEHQTASEADWDFVNDAKKVDIIPAPAELTWNTAVQFNINSTTALLYKQHQLEYLADYTISAVKEWTGIKLGFRKSGNIISLELAAPGVYPEEGYALNVTENKITITASTEKGLFYGVQTLLQLIPVDGSNYITGVAIKDQPRFQWRGMLFDNCRHMFSVDYIKKFIDRLAYHKLNKFHWHLTEDQGWRIEIKKYPKLQEIAAYRNGTQIIDGKRRGIDGIRYGGYYTQEQIKEIVAYAASRHIDVIPEIEMPGHSVAAVTAYPQLACNAVSFETGKPFEVRKVWGVSKDLYCAGNDSVFTFLENVLIEVMQLFPSKYIHIGGDEAPHDAWKKCPKCQKRIKDEGLKDEAGLQSWFIRRMEKFINAHGKQIIGWEEIMQGGLTENATVQSWLGTESGLKAAKEGHDVIMSPYSHLYFDGYQADTKIEPVAIGYWTPLDLVYSFEPVHPDLNETEAKHILGAQANLWTEFIGTEDYLEYMMYPRVAALSEIDWSPKSKRDYKDFTRRLQTQYLRYAKQGIQFRIPTPVIKAVANKDSTLYTISLTNEAGAGIMRYTTDGSDVTPQSPVYSQPVSLPKEKMFRCALFYIDGRKSSTNYWPKTKHS